MVVATSGRGSAAPTTTCDSTRSGSTTSPAPSPSASFTFAAAGTYTLGFGVFNVGDAGHNSALLLDSIHEQRTPLDTVLVAVNFGDATAVVPAQAVFHLERLAADVKPGETLLGEEPLDHEAHRGGVHARVLLRERDRDLARVDPLHRLTSEAWLMV